MLRLNIVGQKFRGLDTYLPGIIAGVDAVLVREPTNAFDPNAVAVWIDGKHVGYLRKEDNGPIAKRIDADGKSWREACLEAGLALDTQALPVEGKSMRAKFARSPSSSYPQVLIED